MITPKLTKKQKKGLAFRERKGKKQNSTLLDEDLAIPQTDPPVNEEEAEVQPESTPPQAEIRNKSITKTKKRKREVDEDMDEPMEPVTKEKEKGAVTKEKEKGAVTKEKEKGAVTKEKEKGAVTKEKEKGAGPEKPIPDQEQRKNKRPKTDDETGEATKRAAPGKARFILFVGNLKYTTSLKAIQEHFVTCDPPPRIRLLTPKPKSPTSSTVKSKGCAFLEFSHRNALQQGLKLHGSTLDGRRINVELTAGGGGKSESRTQKLQSRNKQLLEERKTRVQKKVEAGGEADIDIIAPPQRHSKTSGLEDLPRKRRTWTVPEDGEASGRGGVKKRGKKGKAPTRHWGTGANAVAVG